MPEGLVETAAQVEPPEERRFYGVAVAQVIDNVDLMQQARVQVRLPWLSFTPWARVAVPMAGNDRGTYFIPMIGDEVLVAFNQGDVRDAYVVGSLWNAQDQPPAVSPTDPQNKRLIRTPLGHELEFDDQEESITVTSITGHKIKMTSEKIEIQTAEGTASVILDTEGNVSIKASEKISLEAQTLNLKGDNVTIEGNQIVKVRGGRLCDVQANVVKIN